MRKPSVIDRDLVMISLRALCAALTIALSSCATTAPEPAPLETQETQETQETPEPAKPEAEHTQHRKAESAS